MAKGNFRKAKPIQSFDMELVEAKSSLQEAKTYLNLQEPEKIEMPTSIKARRLDPLTEKLGSAGFFYKMRWPWFIYEFGGINYSLDVHRFYQDKNIALDIGHVDQKLADKKRKLLEDHGIKYIILENAGDFKSLILGLT